MWASGRRPEVCAVRYRNEVRVGVGVAVTQAVGGAFGASQLTHGADDGRWEPTAWLRLICQCGGVAPGRHRGLGVRLKDDGLSLGTAAHGCRSRQGSLSSARVSP